MMKLGALWLNVGHLDYYLVIPIIIENVFDVSVDPLWMVSLVRYFMVYSIKVLNWITSFD